MAVNAQKARHILADGYTGMAFETVLILIHAPAVRLCLIAIYRRGMRVMAGCAIRAAVSVVGACLPLFPLLAAIDKIAIRLK